MHTLVASIFILSHISLNREGRWGATGDFATSFFHFSLFSTALWDLANSRHVHSLMLSSHLFLCLPCLLPPFTVPRKSTIGYSITYYMDLSSHLILSSHVIYPLTARVVGTSQMISQPVSSIFPCSPLPSGTCRTPGLSFP